MKRDICNLLVDVDGLLHDRPPSVWQKLWKRMRAPLFLVLFMIPVAAFAGDVKLQWDPNPAANQVTKYTAKWGAVTGVYPNKLDVIVPSATVTGLAPGKYFFVVTASNAWGESGNSNETSTAPGLPSAPGNLSILIIVTVTVP